MKKLILLLLLIPSLCLAGSIKVEDGGGNVAYDYIAPEVGSSLKTTDMTRGFEADSDPAGWAAETDTDGIYSRYNGTVYHSGSYSASVAGGYTTAAYQVYDMGATKAALSFCFWYYTPTTGGTDTITLLAIGSSGGGSFGLKVYFQYAAGHYHFGLRGATFPYGTVEITNGAWHRLEVDYAISATSTLNVYDAGGTLVETLSVTAGSFSSQYLTFGKAGASARTDWTTGYYDDVGLDFTDATSPLWEYTVAN